MNRIFPRKDIRALQKTNVNYSIKMSPVKC